MVVPWLSVGNGQSSPRQMPRSARCNSLETRVKNSSVGPKPVPAYKIIITSGVGGLYYLIFIVDLQHAPGRTKIINHLLSLF